jgi:hypothetical protein
VVPTIVDEANERIARIDAVDVHPLPSATIERLRDRDVVERFPIPIPQLESRPFSRHAGCNAQRVAFA